MNYWLTTHYPPRKEKDTNNPYAIYLPDGRHMAGVDIAIDDIVLIYESLRGKSILKHDINGNEYVSKCIIGRGGVIALAKVITPLREDVYEKPTRYVDGREIWWKWHADTKLISDNGFVSRQEINRMLGYSLNNALRGFGTKHSGLKKITDEQYQGLIKIYRENNRGDETTKKVFFGKSTSWGGHNQGGESEEHKRLKEYVASDPSHVLKETGLKTLKIEYPFPSGDRADIVLKDVFGKIIGVEIERTVDEDSIVGILQAIKYRYMVAVTEGVSFLETRSFLIAHSITKVAKNICDKYDVECFIVPIKEVGN